MPPGFPGVNTFLRFLIVLALGTGALVLVALFWPGLLVPVAAAFVAASVVVLLLAGAVALVALLAVALVAVLLVAALAVVVGLAPVWLPVLLLVGIIRLATRRPSAPPPAVAPA